MEQELLFRGTISAQGCGPTSIADAVYDLVHLLHQQKQQNGWKIMDVHVMAVEHTTVEW